MQPPFPKPFMARPTRYHISEIELDPTTSTHDVSLVLLIDGRASQSLQKIIKGKSLRWRNINIDATPESKLSLEVLGQRFKLRSQAVSLFDVQQSTQLVIGFAGTTAAKWSATIKPSPAEGVERSLNGALENLMQFLNIPNAPKSTGKVRKILLEFAFIASKIHPSTETAILGLAEVLKKFAEQDEWSEGIRTLVGNLVGMMENVQEVAKSVEIDSLKGIIENMVALFEDVSVFVSEHESRGTTAFKHRLAVGVLDQIKTLSDRYDKLKAEFVTGIGAETHQKIHALGLHEFLGRLQSASPSGHDCDRVCQDGTREDVIDRIMGWTQQLPTRRKSLLWIRGQAGIGKSSIAASVCERLNRTGMLATCFFCKRDDDNFRDPLRLINSLAYGLAARCPEYGRVVANAIRDNMELCNLHMDQRYEGLIRKPLQELCYLSVSPLIIVVDALDECGTPNSRQKLLGHLQDMSQLVPWLGLIVTSRPTPEILDFFSGVPESTTSPIDLQEFDASHDIRAFIERKLIDVAKRDNWPYKSIDRLCERAGGVFIWAAIAVRHILGAMGSTEGRLREILNNQKSPVSNDLDKLYADILSSGMGDREDDNKALVCQCLGAIVIASKHQPLSIPILSTLLEKPTSDLDTVVKNLGSVLYLDGQLGGAVRFYHPSFADYITDPLRSQDFHADLDQQNINFARGCLRIIQKETRFNICELETSYLPNSRVHGLAGRIDTRISKHLRYSCLYWISHVVGSPPETLQEEIRKMTTGPQLIFWLEILSLIDRLDTALIDLPRLIQWLRDALESSAEIIREIYRFISVFRDAIATSTPHLYVSALALCPEKSLVVKELGHFFPKRITIQQGGDEHWPRWLRAITHPTHVMSLAVDQTGRMLATGCYDGTIRLWDLEAGIPIGDPLSGHTESVTSLEFSPNGSRLVSGSVDASVRMWDIQATNLVEGFSINHSDVVTSVAFSGDGKRVISGSWDGTIQISDAETGEPIDPKRPFVVQHHKNPEKILSVASSPDDTQIAYSSESPEHKATVRDLGSGEEQSLIAHAGDITSIMFSRDGAYIITGSADMTVRLWQSKTGDLVGQPLVGHSGFVTAVAFSPDGNKIVSSCNDSVIRIFDSKTNQLIGSSLAGHSGAVTCVAFTPNGAQIISGSLDTTLRIWATETDGNSGTLPAPRFVSIVRSLTNTRPSPVVTPLVTGHVGEVSTVAFSPEGSSIVSGSSDRTARIWDAETGNPIREPLKHNYAVDCLAISPDSRHITTGYNTRVRIWKADKDSPTTLLRAERLTVVTIALVLLLLNYRASHPRADSWFEGSDAGEITGRYARYMRFFIPYICSISLVYSTRTLLVQSYIQHPKEVTCLCFSPDGGRIFSGSRDGEIRAHDTKTGELIGDPLSGSSEPITAITCTSKEGQIIFGSNDGMIRVCDLKNTNWASWSRSSYTIDRFLDTSESLHEEKFKEIVFLEYPSSGGATVIAFAPNKDIVAFGVTDNSIRLWSFDHKTGTGSPVSNALIGHSDIVRSIAFSPVSSLIASGSDDMTVRIWDVQTNSLLGSPLIGHSGPVKSVSFSPNGSRIVSGSADGTIRVWSINSAASSMQPMILESMLHGSSGSPQTTHLGWYSHDKQSLLLWLPIHYRRAYDPRALFCISVGRPRLVQFGHSEFVHGENWASIASDSVRRNAF